MPQTGGLKEQTFISLHSGVWGDGDQDTVRPVSDVNVLPGLQVAAFLWFPRGESGERALWGAFYKGTNPVPDGSHLII